MEKLRKTNKIISLIVIISGLFLVIGLTYAYFVSNVTGSELVTTINTTSGSMKINYSGGPAIVSNNIIPSYTPFATKTFTLTGTNATPNDMGYGIILVIDSNTFTYGAISYTLNGINTGANGTTIPNITNRVGLSTVNSYLGTGKFTGTISNKVHTYELKLYFYETGENQNIDMDKSFEAHVEIIDIPCPDCLKDNILAQGKGANAIKSKGNPDFAAVAPGTLEYHEQPEEITSLPAEFYNPYEPIEIGDGFTVTAGYYGGNLLLTESNQEGSGYTFSSNDIGKYVCLIDFDCGSVAYKINAVNGTTVTGATKYTFKEIYNYSDTGLYSAQDEYGDSYYYRGDRDNLNNNLIFAGFQWKIVRINGDGSIRLLYNGLCPGNECTINGRDSDSTIGLSVYNNIYTGRENKHMGYMFGGAIGVASTSRASATTNETSSTIKTTVDNWYINNILGTGYESKIEDNLFCNDRQLQNEVGGPATGTGFGTSATVYAAYYRTSVNKTPTLKCGLKNDRFTVSDTSKGNGALTYSVGLLTADEVLMGGLITMGSASTYSTPANYLTGADTYWLMSPFNVSSYQEIILSTVFSSNPSFMLHTGQHSTSYGVRPVINLKSTVRATGTGTVANPFKVVS